MTNSSFSKTIFVDGDIVASGDGTSWFKSIKTITEAIDTATSGDQIWIADGMYNESITLTSGVFLLGGFSGIEDNEVDRNPKKNITIIDAENLPSLNSVVILENVSFTTIDGFTISNGTSEASSGGGLLIRDCPSTITIKNCIIKDNYAIGGGGLGAFRSKIEIYGCEFVNNSVKNNGGGGGIACADLSLKLFDCIFDGNFGGSIGGGISIGRAIDGDITSCTFINNKLSSPEGNGGGGGIHCTSLTSPILISDCYFANNDGTGIYRSTGESPIVSNSIFTGNRFSGISGIWNITGCEVYANNLYGIVVGLARPSFIKQCRIYDNANHGIRVNGFGIIKNCLIYNNGGAGVLVSGGSATEKPGNVRDLSKSENIKMFNKAPGISGGISYQAILQNCTIYNNTLGGMWLGNPQIVISSALAQNCIFSKNQKNAIEVNDNRSVIGIYGNLFFENTPNDFLFDRNNPLTFNGGKEINTFSASALNISGDPLFQNLEKSEFKILINSPAIDNGTTQTFSSGEFPPSIDFISNPRPVDVPGYGKDKTGDEIDIGAYEFDPSFFFIQQHILGKQLTDDETSDSLNSNKDELIDTADILDSL